MVKVIKAKKEEDHDEYAHVYLGVPLTDDENSVIKRSWIEAAVDAHLKLNIDMSGRRCVGYDVADSGEDKNATAEFNGTICENVDEWKAGEDELTQSTRRAWSLVRNGVLIYDSIGVGAHVGSTLKDMNIYSGFYKFNAGGAVIDPKAEYAPKIKNGEKFENLKAQAWQNIADKFRNTYNAINKGMTFDPGDMISINSNIDKIEKLKTELSTPRKKYSKRGLDMVETKDQLAQRDIKSPNLADAFIMGAFAPVRHVAPISVSFAT